jgi:hypothetical protein
MVALGLMIVDNWHMKFPDKLNPVLSIERVADNVLRAGTALVVGCAIAGGYNFVEANRLDGQGEVGKAQTKSEHGVEWLFGGVGATAIFGLVGIGLHDIAGRRNAYSMRNVREMQEGDDWGF